MESLSCDALAPGGCSEGVCDACCTAALHFLVYFSVVHGAFAHGVGVRCDDAGAFVDARSVGAGSLVGGT